MRSAFGRHHGCGPPFCLPTIQKPPLRGLPGWGYLGRRSAYMLGSINRCNQLCCLQAMGVYPLKPKAEATYGNSQDVDSASCFRNHELTRMWKVCLFSLRRNIFRVELCHTHWNITRPSGPLFLAPSGERSETGGVSFSPPNLQPEGLFFLLGNSLSKKRAFRPRDII